MGKRSVTVKRWLIISPPVFFFVLKKNTLKSGLASLARQAAIDVEKNTGTVEEGVQKKTKMVFDIPRFYLAFFYAIFCTFFCAIFLISPSFLCVFFCISPSVFVRFSKVSYFTHIEPKLAKLSAWGGPQLFLFAARFRAQFVGTGFVRCSSRAAFFSLVLSGMSQT